MNIQQLRYVLAIADHGSFREAAKILTITQPSLSHGVKELEIELGLALFTRTNRGALLTKEGQNFYQQAEKIINQIDCLQASFSDDLQIENLTISNQYFQFTAQAVNQVLEKFPQIKNIHLLDKTLPAIVDDVVESRSEIGVVGFYDYESEQVIHQLQQKNLQFKKILAAPPQVYLRNQHPLSRKSMITKEELANYPKIRLIDANASHTISGDEYVRHSQQVVETSDKGTLEGILKRSNAYTIGLQLFISHTYITSINLAQVANYYVYIIYKNEQLSESAAHFFNEVSDLLR